MRNRSVTLVDLGLDAGFDASMQFVQATLSSHNAGFDAPVVDVNFVRSRDPDTIWGGLTSPSTVLHVLAHGDHDDDPQFISSDGMTEVSLAYLAENFTGIDQGVAAPVILADGCKTGVGIWKRALRDCLQGPVTYIGTSSTVGWSEGTVFAGAFYGALLRDRGLGRSFVDQGLEAARRASEAYELILGRKSPYRAALLEPSRKALRTIADRRQD